MSPLKIMRTGPSHRTGIDSYQMHYSPTIIIIVNITKVVGLCY